MDPIIKRYDFKNDVNLNYCYADGVAYQTDMSKSVPYDLPYFEKYIMYEKTPMGRELNRARVSAVKRWAAHLKIMDVGVGCGTFMKYALGADLTPQGFDINPCAIHWLHKRQLFDNPYKTANKYMCYTFWDSLEHIPDPQKLLEKIAIGAYVFVSMPIYSSLDDVRMSKHYRPNEHYYYFTTTGFLKWMLNYGFVLRRVFNFEEKCGRVDIKTFMLERIIVKKNKKAEYAREYFSRELKETADLAKLIGGIK